VAADLTGPASRPTPAHGGQDHGPKSHVTGLDHQSSGITRLRPTGEYGFAMKQLYRGLAYLIAAGVALQAAAIAYAVFALFDWVSAGGTIDKALIETDSPQIGGIIGFNLHGLVGIFIMPLLALMLVICSFFAKISRGIIWAVIVFAATVVQALVGLFSHEVAGLGWLHGVGALILFGCAITAAMRVKRTAKTETAATESGTPAPVS